MQNLKLPNIRVGYKHWRSQGGGGGGGAKVYCKGQESAGFRQERLVRAVLYTVLCVSECYRQATPPLPGKYKCTPTCRHTSGMEHPLREILAHPLSANNDF